MNVVKVTFDIDIDNNEQLSAFNAFVGALRETSGATPVVQAPVKDIRQKTQAAQPAQTTQAAQPAQTTTKATTDVTDTKKLDLIRSKLGPKLGSNREAIKAKLSEFGAPNLTELAVDKWDAFEAFIDSLS